MVKTMSMAFVLFMKDELNVRIIYLEEILTKPDRDEGGFEVPGTGGRNDLIFAIHRDDLSDEFCFIQIGVRDSMD